MIMSHKPPKSHRVLMISRFLSRATYTTVSPPRCLLFNALHSPASGFPSNYHRKPAVWRPLLYLTYRPVSHPHRHPDEPSTTTRITAYLMHDFLQSSCRSSRLESGPTTMSRSQVLPSASLEGCTAPHGDNSLQLVHHNRHRL